MTTSDLSGILAEAVSSPCLALYSPLPVRQCNGLTGTARTELCPDLPLSLPCLYHYHLLFYIFLTQVSVRCQLLGPFLE
jgi:hypothetical protein